MKNKKLGKLILASVFTAIVFITTFIIRIPTPTKGYVNLGDSMTIVSGWELGIGYGAIAAALGSALADIISGYFIYAPATFTIKFLMAMESYIVFTLINKKLNSFFAKLISSIIAEIIMCFGYFIFEGILYNFPTALIGIPANLFQGVIGVVGSLIIYEYVIKRISNHIKK